MSDIEILTSARVHDKQVGGNTRYVREVYARLTALGGETRFLRIPKNLDQHRLRSPAYAVFESWIWPSLLKPQSGRVMHFPADTGGLRRSRVPVVGTIHGLATLHVPDVRSGGADRLWRFRVRGLARVADKIITVSESSAEDIISFAPETIGRVEVVPHGINHDVFNTRSLGTFSEENRHRLGVPASYFLYAGNIEPRKNIPALIDAAESVFRTTGVPLVISGAPAWDSDAIMSKLRASRGVIYVGRTDDDQLVSLMQNAVAFCFPSHYEGFGFPVLEAMACGSPVICSTRGSLRSVAARGALALDDISAESIEGAMMAVLEDDDLRSRLISDGLKHVSGFTWESSATRHMEIFREVAA
ncbi:glycosyltransferase family 1 protein [Microbacterium sp. ABRD28]|uniref:glycosyltransferase family 4 protein n=1 Tax=Microbacterium sp. ABRD28 TaxID=2268461 RepID=UPI0013DDC35F|nr:glycosyltransferase family 1 protein [Microbacterium sp. ABRD28]